jgi:hypothetical protein
MGYGDIPGGWRVTVQQSSNFFWDELTVKEGIVLVSGLENSYGHTLTRMKSTVV